MGTTADNPAPREKPWMRAFGGLRDLHRETLRVERLIEQEFECIDEEDAPLLVAEADAVGGGAQVAGEV